MDKATRDKYRHLLQGKRLPSSLPKKPGVEYITDDEYLELLITREIVKEAFEKRGKYAAEALRKRLIAKGILSEKG